MFVKICAICSVDYSPSPTLQQVLIITAFQTKILIRGTHTSYYHHFLAKIYEINFLTLLIIGLQCIECLEMYRIFKKFLKSSLPLFHGYVSDPRTPTVYFSGIYGKFFVREWTVRESTGIFRTGMDDTGILEPCFTTIAQIRYSRQLFNYHLKSLKSVWKNRQEWNSKGFSMGFVGSGSSGKFCSGMDGTGSPGTVPYRTGNFPYRGNTIIYSTTHGRMNVQESHSYGIN